MDTTPIEQQLEQARRLLQSYQDIAAEQDEDESFVARGNGFCDRKYSQEFLDMQVAGLAARVADLEDRINSQRHDI